MLLNLPNCLTLLRIALIPVFVAVFYSGQVWANEMAALVFALAAITDWLDGYFARRLDQTSAFGAFLDPVADKLMVAVALILLVEANPWPGLAIPAAIIIGREITVSALREWMAEMGERGTVKVSMIGKFKTSAQMIAILFLLYRDPLLGLSVETIGYVALYVSAWLTVWSMFVYLRAAWPSLVGGEK
ncbi:MAG TPA: CDP-diacylglycerol--glycerol-3-phosphate 3-phosphatidyltransferase [Chromatiaceae bacterium]|jgi:CDP-diacylglycerol--glycerol-3-phosphate 3-phosphatidyltransferase/cardiolipin synthase|nr:CDP-diacylglycerol--glycerol-3-phosphate 3-phosphatidyltransferase [Chromatiaceae bacterium]HIN81648.1 CDP-diacylglycerol--glycerol-3-phosphate 3-phosphatidyltransferase [Chromatiales bacterium]HIA07548.1 CDP-diacylglycerol--glycerol-3-phosphate 3-phosphatidyltransferase [Chromatiaceae bacterium]HIB83953.1 CDP-diacylglycerol--glycerol-3-phosphate 3-phosphatidyltransferase [Chromatiaceae bacterium]HIO14598.1 CDP-diacylglycerol--glycerol-3-phosphate 3-phosphatidyltransferase [Chromatiales bact